MNSGGDNYTSIYSRIYVCITKRYFKLTLLINHFHISYLTEMMHVTCLTSPNSFVSSNQISIHELQPIQAIERSDSDIVSKMTH